MAILEAKPDQEIPTSPTEVASEADYLIEQAYAEKLKAGARLAGILVYPREPVTTKVLVDDSGESYTTKHIGYLSDEQLEKFRITRDRLEYIKSTHPFQEVSTTTLPRSQAKDYGYPFGPGTRAVFVGGYKD